MGDAPDPQPVDPGLVRYLRLLVTVLTAVMIAGFLVIVFLFITKFKTAFGPELPAAIALPEGTEALAFTQGRGWYAVVTGDDEILIYDQKSGALRQRIPIRTAE